MTLEEEEALLVRIKKEPKAFGEIFDLHYSTVFGYIMRRTADYRIRSQRISDHDFSYNSNLKELGISIKIKWFNLSIIFICLVIFGILFLYALAEGGPH